MGIYLPRGPEGAGDYHIIRMQLPVQERFHGADHPHFISCSDSLAKWEAEQSDAGALAGGVAEGQERLIILVRRNKTQLCGQMIAKPA